MSAWHDPRGRLIVDGYGKPLRDGDEVRRLLPRSYGVSFYDPGRLRHFHCVKSTNCHHVAIWCKRNVRGLFMPHSCRPERRR